MVCQLFVVVCSLWFAVSCLLCLLVAVGCVLFVVCCGVCCLLTVDCQVLVMRVCRCGYSVV